MRGSKRIVLVTAIVVGVIGVSGASGQPHGCVDGVTWEYCGEHVRAADLPLRFRVSMADAPAGIGVGSVAAAAASQWNAAWPLPNKPLAFAGTTTAGFGEDGQNTILFGDPGLCGGRADSLAIACLWYEGSGGAAAHRIKEADIIISTDRNWKNPTQPADLVVGEAAGLAPLGQYDSPWYDLASVITHELGHSLGLEDIGDASRPFPATSADAPKYMETMYGHTYPFSTNKRSLGGGDVFALQLAAFDSVTDKGD